MTLIQHLLGRAAFPPRFAWFLEGRWRRLVLGPERLQQRLALAPELTVLELGVGGGYYARPLSRLVRRYIALDLQREMLNRLRRKSGGAALLPVQADATQLPIASGSVDVVIAITVLGEVPSAEKTIAEVRRVLRPGGVFSVSEHWPDPDFLPFGRVNALCERCGLELQGRYGGRINYTANFRAAAG
ncbi:MAG TPA: class I SAM-dependent methyltransferase [Gemmatimonadales bacterium]|nr:class I SAM-dependent methyltransferase [Gemmatimonadales bacterium]